MRVAEAVRVRPRLKVGAVIPTFGDLPSAVGIHEMARVLEEAGFGSIWVTDHILLPAATRSYYPFSDDGVVTWSATRPYHDAITSLALAVGATSDIEIGTAVLVLPLRQPIVLATQIAALDVESGGRVSLGVGAGWLREEFDALGVEFSSRGRRTDESIDLLRACWTGSPAEFRGEFLKLPPGMHFFPTPVHRIPILVGGMSSRALDRVASKGDGWVGLQRFERFSLEEVASSIETIRSRAESYGRDPDAFRIILRIINSHGAAPTIGSWLRDLSAVGVTEIIVDVRWDQQDAADVSDVLRAQSG